MASMTLARLSTPWCTQPLGGPVQTWDGPLMLQVHGMKHCLLALQRLHLVRSMQPAAVEAVLRAKNAEHKRTIPRLDRSFSGG